MSNARQLVDEDIFAARRLPVPEGKFVTPKDCAGLVVVLQSETVPQFLEGVVGHQASPSYGGLIQVYRRGMGEEYNPRNPTEVGCVKGWQKEALRNRQHAWAASLHDGNLSTLLSLLMPMLFPPSRVRVAGEGINMLWEVSYPRMKSLGRMFNEGSYSLKVNSLGQFQICSTGDSTDGFVVGERPKLRECVKQDCRNIENCSNSLMSNGCHHIEMMTMSGKIGIQLIDDGVNDLEGHNGSAILLPWYLAIATTYLITSMKLFLEDMEVHGSPSIPRMSPAMLVTDAAFNEVNYLTEEQRQQRKVENEQNTNKRIQGEIDKLINDYSDEFYINIASAAGLIVGITTCYRFPAPHWTLIILEFFVSLVLVMILIIGVCSLLFGKIARKWNAKRLAGALSRRFPHDFPTMVFERLEQHNNEITKMACKLLRRSRAPATIPALGPEEAHPSPGSVNQIRHEEAEPAGNNHNASPVVFKFSCPHCGQHLSAMDSFAGLEANCPTCNGKFIVQSS